MSGRRRIILSWAALLVLLALTTGLAYLPLGRAGLPAALAIAIVKAVVILGAFMELARASSLSRIVAAAGFFWLCILLGMPAVDYLSRHDRAITEADVDGAAVPLPAPVR